MSERQSYYPEHAERDEARAELDALKARCSEVEREWRSCCEREAATFEEVKTLRAQCAALRAALEHCIDLGPPCPACGAEDEEVESEGLYPHAADCLAWVALAHAVAVAVREQMRRASNHLEKQEAAAR